jgi:hypothetical protein
MVVLQGTFCRSERPDRLTAGREDPDDDVLEYENVVMLVKVLPLREYCNVPDEGPVPDLL